MNLLTIAIIAKNGMDSFFTPSVKVSGVWMIHSIATAAMMLIEMAVTAGGIFIVALDNT